MEIKIFDLEVAIATAKAKQQQALEQREQEEKRYEAEQYEKDLPVFQQKLVNAIGSDLINDLGIKFEPCDRYHASNKVMAVFEIEDLRFEIWYGGQHNRCFSMSAASPEGHIDSVEFYYPEIDADSLLLGIDKLLKSPRPSPESDEDENEVRPEKQHLVKQNRINKRSTSRAFAAANGDDWQDGMTLHEYYVGQAIAGLSSNPEAFSGDSVDDWIAGMAIAVADKVIEKLVD